MTDISQLQGTNKRPTGLSSIFTVFRRIAAEPESTDTARITTADNLSAPYILSASERQHQISLLHQAALAASNPRAAHADPFWQLAAIHARKGDTARALALLSNYLQWRDTLEASATNPCTSAIMEQQLRRRVVFVAGNTDRDGRPVLSIRLRNQDPSTFSALHTVRTISFVLEWTLRTFPTAQTHGVLLVACMRDATFRNMDVRVPAEMQRAFSRNLPVRVSAIYICNPPPILKAVFSLVARVMSDKIKARIRVLSHNDAQLLAQQFDSDQIMDDLQLGGTASWTDEQHAAWIERMKKDCQTWAPATTSSEAPVHT